MKEEWKALQQVVQDKTKHLIRLHEVEKLIKTESDSFDSIQQQYNKEHKDVEKLTKPSLTNIFYTLNGKKEEQLQKEQSELDDITEKVTKKNEELTSLKEELEELKELVRLIEKAEKQQDKLAAIVEQRLWESSSTFCSLLTQLDDEKKELDQTEKHLNDVLKSIDDLMRSTVKSNVLLESAKSLGMVDMVTDNMALSVLKRAKLKETQEQLHITIKLVEKLKYQLDSFQWDEEISLPTDNFTLLLDVFMDNIFTDWKVQEDIKKAMLQVKTLKEQAFTLFEEVMRSQLKLKQKYDGLRAKRFSLLEQFM